MSISSLNHGLSHPKRPTMGVFRMWYITSNTCPSSWTLVSINHSAIRFWWCFILIIFTTFPISTIRPACITVPVSSATPPALIAPIWVNNTCTMITNPLLCKPWVTGVVSTRIYSRGRLCSGGGSGGGGGGGPGGSCHYICQHTWLTTEKKKRFIFIFNI